MENTYRREKIRIILIPHLILAFSFPAAYIAFTWFRHSVLKFEEENSWLYFWIPASCIVFLLILLFRHRYRILVHPKGAIATLFIAGCCILAPTMIGQHYITKVVYPLVSVERISAIKQEDYQRYYAIRNFYVDTSSRYTLMKRKTVNKGGTVQLDFYLVAPMHDDKSKWPTPARAWYALHFAENVSNRIDPEIREAQIYSRWQKAKSKWQQLDLSEIQYFENCIDLTYRPGFLEAVKKRLPSASENIALLMPVYTPFEKRDNLTRNWLILSFLIGAAFFSFLVLTSSVDYIELPNYLRDIR
jgi:rhomboid protease GluP